MRGVLLQICLLTALLGVAMCQRPPYIAGPVVYPETLQQFGGSEGGGLSSRFGSDGSRGSSSRSLPGSIYQDELVNQVASNYPANKRPFWFLNNRQIAAHRGLNA